MPVLQQGVRIFGGPVQACVAVQQEKAGGGDSAGVRLGLRWGELIFMGSGGGAYLHRFW